MCRESVCRKLQSFCSRSCCRAPVAVTDWQPGNRSIRYAQARAASTVIPQTIIRSRATTVMSISSTWSEVKRTEACPRSLARHVIRRPLLTAPVYLGPSTRKHIYGKAVLRQLIPILICWPWGIPTAATRSSANCFRGRREVASDDLTSAGKRRRLLQSVVKSASSRLTPYDT